MLKLKGLGEGVELGEVTVEVSRISENQGAEFFDCLSSKQNTYAKLYSFQNQKSLTD